jgi:xylulokinase
LVADIFNCEVVRVVGDEAGATGAALQAFWCDNVTNFKNITIEEITSTFVKLDESSRMLPKPSTACFYDEAYQKYLKFNEAMFLL